MIRSNKGQKRTVTLKEPPSATLKDKKDLNNEIYAEEVLNRDYKKMETFMLLNGQIQQNYIKNKIEEWDEKMYGNKNNKLSLEEILELRAQERQSKKKFNDSFYDRYLPAKTESSVTNRLENYIVENQLERDGLQDMYSKIIETIPLKDKTDTTYTKEFKFPLNESASKRIIIKNSIDSRNDSNVLGFQNSQYNNNINNNSGFVKQDNIIEKNKQKNRQNISNGFLGQKNNFQDDQDNYNEDQNNEDENEDDEDDDDEDDDDDDYSDEDDSISGYGTMQIIDDRSNFDKASMTSKARSQIEREWEYNSQRDYNILDIPKLTDLQEIEIPNFKSLNKETELEQGDNKNDDNNKQQNDDKKSIDNQTTNSQTSQQLKNTQSVVKKKNRITNVKLERTYEEFLLMDIHDKIDNVVTTDYIQKISFSYNQGNVIHPENQVQFYRDITPQARDLLSVSQEYRGIYYEQDRLALLETEDIYIETLKIGFQDITNIISDRVPESLIEPYCNPKYVAENFNKYSYVPEKNSKSIVEKLTYTSSLNDVKKLQYLEMKSYFQKMKTWEDKEFQTSHKDIVNETKSVTDWLMEDLFHIRKATISSYGLDFNPKVNKVLQTQLYHKFEQKLLLLLQIILYRENIPQWKVPKDIFGKPEISEEEQKQIRINLDKKRDEDEQKFYSLFTSESQLVSDLKKLLRDVKILEKKTVDGRSKSELLKIFLVDYNDIVKFKNEQLNKIKQIEEELGEINQNFSQIEGKSLYERLYEQKIGNQKDQESETMSDQQILSQLGSKREQLLKQRQSILQNSAQIFTINEDIQNDNSPSQSYQQQQTKSNKQQTSQSNMNKQKTLNPNYDNNNILSNNSKAELYIPLERANSSYRGSKQNLTPQRVKSNISRQNTSQQYTPVSTTKSIYTNTNQDRPLIQSQQLTQSRQKFNRNLHKSYTQKSLFGQYNQQNTLVDFSPTNNDNSSRADSRLTNRQIFNATPIKDRDQLDQPQYGGRRTPETTDSKYLKHSNTTNFDNNNLNSTKENNEVKQINLFSHNKKIDNQQSQQSLNRSIINNNNSSIQQQMNGYNRQQNYYCTPFENDIVKTKIERNKQRDTSNNSILKQQSSYKQQQQLQGQNYNNSNQGLKSSASKSSLSNIQEKDWRQVFKNAKHRSISSNKK